MPRNDEPNIEARHRVGGAAGDAEVGRGLALVPGLRPGAHSQAGLRVRHGTGPRRAPGPCDDGLRHAYGPRW